MLLIFPLHDDDVNTRLIARAMEKTNGKWKFLFSEAQTEASHVFVGYHHTKVEKKFIDINIKSNWCSSMRQALKLATFMVKSSH